VGGKQWPTVAVRRFMLYDVLLHELGHLQIVHEKAKSVRRKFSMETKAQEFGMLWCERLWDEHFDHPDPVHNRPTSGELADEQPEITHLLTQVRLHGESPQLLQKLGNGYVRRRQLEAGKEALSRALGIDPDDPYTNLCLGFCHYKLNNLREAVGYYLRATDLAPNHSAAYRYLGAAYEKMGNLDLADVNYQCAVKVDPSDKVARRRLNALKLRTAAQ
jgi:Flp pilus assembly protein TadD